jgi:hypothetical protein
VQSLYPPPGALKGSQRRRSSLGPETRLFQRKGVRRGQTHFSLYLSPNLDKHAAIAQTLDAESNLRAQDRMKQLAADPRLIIPGHDPAVMTRFPNPQPGVARIQ